MGWKLKRIELSGEHRVKPNEERDLVIELEKETRAAIHGVVKFPDGRPVKDAVVKLFCLSHENNCNKCKLIPVTFTFTDDCGQFLFGVKSGVDYVVKVFFYKPEKKVCHEKSDCDCDWDE